MASVAVRRPARRKRLALHLAIILTATALVSPWVQQGSTARATTGTFANPIMWGGPYFDDPVYYQSGYYYAIAAVDGASLGSKMLLLKSPTLEGLDHPIAFKVLFDVDSSGFEATWPPRITYLNGHWYFYASVHRKGGGSNTDRTIIVSQGPTGDPFGTWGTPTDMAAGVTPLWAYDPAILQKSDGSLYMVYAANPSGLNQYPAYLYIAPLSDPTTFSGGGIVLAKAGYDHPSDANPDPNLSWETQSGNLNEAPDVLIHNGVISIVYNANSNDCTCYKWGLLKNTNGNVTDPNSWTKSLTSVFQMGSTNVEGPGNHWFTTSPDGTEGWVVYSVKYAAIGSAEINAQKFTWNADNTPNFNGGVPIGRAVAQSRPSGEADTNIPSQIWYDAEFGAITHATATGGTNFLGAESFGAVSGLCCSDSNVEYDRVNVPTAGTYKLAVKYSTAWLASATQPWTVNGTSQTSISLPYTTGWSDFQVVTTNVTLNAGNNIIKLGNNGSAADIDGIEIDRQDSEFGTLSGGASVVSRSNAENGRTVGTLTTTSSCVDDWRIFNANASGSPGGGALWVRVRYSAPAAAGITISVNGTTPSSVSLTSTGSNNTFSTKDTLMGNFVANGFNDIKICWASGSPEIDSVQWF